MISDFWRGKRVLVTGHTGFKGGWLCLWLQTLGADVHGFSLPPPTNPCLFEIARIEEGMASSTLADIRDQSALSAAMDKIRPELIFHLAAQPLVRRSYQAPLETYGVNVMGLAHLLEAVRTTGGVKAVVNVTSDKCYENQEWPWSYRENERLGGLDPYSSSKACAELVTAAYRHAFLAHSGTAIATARAGNVIGGGDWATDRLLPDFFRAMDAGTPLAIRSPHAVRPWQHVLEPLAGYLSLAKHLDTGGKDFAEAWNFGPTDDDAQSVGWIINQLTHRTPGAPWRQDLGPQPHEAHILKLDSSKARARLGWKPRWNLATALDKTWEWHQAWRDGQDMQAVTLAQLDTYLRAGTFANSAPQVG